jgi:MraZ protein
MLVGTYLVSLTSGKRVSIPVTFRQELGSNLILARWYENCLVLVGEKEWDVLLKRITGGEHMIIEPIRASEHFIYASAYKVDTDDQGRIVLPERLISYAGLGDSVYVLGVRDRVEIWNKEVWETREKEVAKGAASYIEQLANENKFKKSE